jgi:hypothetical protein
MERSVAKKPNKCSNATAKSVASQQRGTFYRR